MTAPVVIIGAGGFGREVLDVLEAINAAAVTPEFAMLGFVDAAPSEITLERLRNRGASWLGTMDEMAALDPTVVRYLIGIGNPAIRRRIDSELTVLGFEAAIAVHPSASVGSASSISAGSIVCGGVQLSTNVTLGRHVHVNPNATIGHDSVLQDHVSINPAAVISGEVVVETGALIGAGAVVLQGLRVGRSSVVGASACVVRDVSPDTVVKGVPAL